jgi:superfamily II DNA or RNA helicase
MFSGDPFGNFYIPRGYARQLHVLARGMGLEPVYADFRRSFEMVDYTFAGELKDYQKLALNDILTRSFGVLQAGTGAGKTVIALATVVARKQPTLVMVHTKELLDQWVQRIEQFLGIKAGRIGGGVFDPSLITVGTVQTIKKKIKEIVTSFGYIIVDECHRTPSSTFLECVSLFDCKYMLGLSATPYRRDNLGKIIYVALGDRVHEVNKNHLYRSGAILRPLLNIRKTNFQYAGDSSSEYQKMINELIHDPDRNKLIVNDIMGEINQDETTVLVVADRINHLQIIAKSLDLQGFPVHVLTGKTLEKERQQIVKDLADGKVKILASTSSLIGEGFDCPGLSTLYLCSPIRFPGKLIQIVGRILRPKEGKKPKIFDYQDTMVGVLEYSANCRNKIYEDEYSN